MGIIDSIFGTYSDREIKRIIPLRDKVLSLEEKYAGMSDKELKAQTGILKDRLAAGETTNDILPDAFAVCREASFRVLGMKHFPVQIIGGIVLHQGRIAEMRTGEGKTLVATLPAYLNALTGKGVHIVTVNDYLAKRDSEWMGKVYRFLGLSVGLIIHGVSPEERRKSYNADITYGTNNEFGFDYLRDNMVIYKKDKVQREFNFCIVDEVDSILVDEARTPLIISGQGDKSTELYEVADRFAKTLKMAKVKELDDKVDEISEVDGDFIVDEKAKTATLTPSGVKKAESAFNVENLMDPDNMTLLHHINQAIKARGIMKRDIDYVVRDGEVIIVDEFTGRLMIGRRFNEGLHQAIEAKEGVKVARESKTLATITFQNFFRLYEKLSGMTGTALTEEAEFREIYSLDVIEIPTNKPMLRKDLSDVVFKTEKAKFNAVIEKIIECHKKGQPVLVGTISIEKSEQLSGLLRRRGVKHEVLNAKYHEKEAEIVAQAGKKGAVTIATNMAGRGTDIMLGGNPEYMAKAEMRKMGMEEELISESTGHADTDNAAILEARETFKNLNQKYKDAISEEAKEVREAGGLCIIGTERHESRRIDNQLRGRSGRQGDPGESQFYLSLDDDLMRLFGGERVTGVMNALNTPEELPIESKMLSNVIEGAQRKVEGRNFSIRKNVLQYDDVMNGQRDLIYKQRAEVLNGDDIKESILKMLEDTVRNTVSLFLSGDIQDNWNLQGLKDNYMGYLTRPEDFKFTPEELGALSSSDIEKLLIDRATEMYEDREKTIGSEVMRELERVILLQNVDKNWMDHIDAMDELRRGINLRAYGQKNPVVEYRIEGFDMFEEMVETIRENTVKMLLTVRLENKEQLQRKQVAKPTEATLGGDRTVKKMPVRKTKVGRNDPCPCGSGKKYKKCCGKEDSEA